MDAKPLVASRVPPIPVLYEDFSQPQLQRSPPTTARSAQTPALSESLDALQPPPRPSEAMYHGLVGEVMRAGAEGKEANPVAIGAVALSWLSARFGRGPFLSIGDVKHHARLYTAHVGRSSRGGKGEATGLMKRIGGEIFKAEDGPRLLGQQHLGGLSSREGLALLIHDGYRSRNKEIPAIDDKRLWVYESEFANILVQGKREGNSLSSALRVAWDGDSIQPATKSAPIWASNPHVALHVCITPSELLAKISTADLNNGFANRFLFVWAERTALVPFPAPTDDAVVDRLAGEVATAIRFALRGYPAEQDCLPMKLSAESRDLYGLLYGELRIADRCGELVTGLLERRPPMLLRIAMILALCDGDVEIRPAHLLAAKAWVDYGAQTVRHVFSALVNPEVEAERDERTRKLRAWLAQAPNDWRSRTEIIRGCFSGRISKSELDATLNAMLSANELHREEQAGEGSKPRTCYRAANLPNLLAGQGSRPFSADAKDREVRAASAVHGAVNSQTSDPNSQAESPAGQGSSTTSQVHADLRKERVVRGRLE